jgi:hypothetical protein
MKLYITSKDDLFISIDNEPDFRKSRNENHENQKKSEIRKPSEKGAENQKISEKSEDLATLLKSKVITLDIESQVENGLIGKSISNYVFYKRICLVHLC